MEEKWKFFRNPQVWERILNADIVEVTLDLLVISDRGPSEYVVPAGYKLLEAGHRDRAKAMLQQFLNVFRSTGMLKQGAEYMLRIMIHRDMVDPATLQPFVDLCREMDANVQMPDPNSSAIVYM